MSAVLSAFGVEGTVTPVGGDPVETTVVWLPVSMEDVPGGMPTRRREAIRMLGVSKADVPNLPRGSLVEAPEVAGGASRTWEVDAADTTDVDEIRVIVVPKDVETKGDLAGAESSVRGHHGRE